MTFYEQLCVCVCVCVCVCLQAQFVFVIFLTLYNLFTGCEYDRKVQWALAIYVATQFFLFMNFYLKSYGKKRDRSPDNRNGNSSSKAHSSIPSNSFRNFQESSFHGRNDAIRKRKEEQFAS